MGEIIKLDQSVYNRISAGEVVERPYSVVKELAENSIDAGANSITIEIHRGGKESVTVIDNGSGILPEDMPTAFMPHATSKIYSADDLDRIITLGFRGEALPSIAAVADVQMQSRRHDRDDGYYIKLSDGAITERGIIGMSEGTIITVSNIFKHLPARAKFLKKDKSEESDITGLIRDLILANPNIQFTYIADGKTIFSSGGRGLEDAVYTVYNRDITNNLLPISFERGGYRIRGFISRPNYTKPTRSYQTTVINGRIINNQTVSAAVAQGYGNGLMRRAFPVFILDITMPFDKLDVNVTPSKTDVRFENAREVFGNVYLAVESALNKALDIISLSNEDEITRDKDLDDKADIAASQKQDSFQLNSRIYSDKVNQAQINSENKIENIAFSGPKATDNNQTSKALNNKEIGSDLSDLRAELALLRLNSKPIERRTGLNDSGEANYKQPNFIKEERLNFEIIGQIFDTYLVIKFGELLYLIDQHAAHERLIYDKLSLEIENNYVSSQMLLLPEIIELSPADADYIGEIIEDLQAIGFDIEEFGSNSFKISAIPSVFYGFKVKNYIDEILLSRRSFQQIKLKNLLRDKLAITACKAAVKAGDTLNDTEITLLLKSMRDDMPLQCPHGRPAIIKIRKKDIDKLFKRVL